MFKTSASLSPQLASLVGLTVGVGAFSVVVACLGEAGMFKRSPPLLHAFIGVTVVFACLLTAAAALSVNQRDQLAKWLKEVPDDDIAALTKSLGLSLTKGELLRYVRDSLLQLALAFGVMTGVLLILMADAVIVLLELQRLRSVAALLLAYGGVGAEKRKRPAGAASVFAARLQASFRGKKPAVAHDDEEAEQGGAAAGASSGGDGRRPRRSISSRGEKKERKEKRDKKDKKDRRDHPPSPVVSSSPSPNKRR
jgi:hypothetical protein